MAQEDRDTGYVLYGDHRSGNCYKAAWILEATGRAYSWRETDVIARETRTAGFLALNPNGRVPLLQLPDGRLLAESNAVLIHLAEGSPYLPADAYMRALVYQWLFFEQYSHEPYIAVARFLCHFDHGLPLDPARMRMLDERGHEALRVMDGELSTRPYMASDDFTIADMALYAYTHTAGDGGFDLAPYSNIVRWLERVAARPGHFSMADLAG